MIESRVSAVEQRAGIAPDTRDLDQQLQQARRDKGSAIEALDFEKAAHLRDSEKQAPSRKGRDFPVA